MDRKYPRGYDPDTVSEKFYLKRSIALAVLLVFTPVGTAFAHPEILRQTFFLVAMGVLAALSLVFLILLLTVPFIEIHAHGVRFRYRLFSRKSDLAFDRILGMSMISFKQTGQKEQKLLRLLVRREGGHVETETIGLLMLSEPEQLINRLKRNVREFDGKHITSAVKSLGGDPLPRRMKYLSYTFGPEGISWRQLGRKTVAWEDITRVAVFNTESSLAAAVLVMYKQEDGKERMLRVGRSLGGGFQDMVRYLVLSASDAQIDPAVIPVLAKKEVRSSDLIRPLIITGIAIVFVSFFIAPFAVPAYRLLVGAEKLKMLFLLFSFLTIVFVLMFIVSVYKKQSGVKGFKPTTVAWGYSLVLILLVGGFYVVNSPLLPYTMLGDMYFSWENYEKADAWYKKTLSVYPENQTLLVGLGELHNEVGDYDEAYGYLERAYEIDPSYYTDWEAGLLLDSLNQQKRCRESLAWGERILSDHPGDSKLESEVQKYRKIANNTCTDSFSDIE